MAYDCGLMELAAGNAVLKIKKINRRNFSFVRPHYQSADSIRPHYLAATSVRPLTGVLIP